jgi:hypothetical protein
MEGGQPLVIANAEGHRTTGSVVAYIAILAGVVNFLPHPNPPLSKGRE